MEFVEAAEKIGLPGAVVIAVILAGMSVWRFYQSDIWPYQKARMEREFITQQERDERDYEQQRVLALALNDQSHEISRIIERLDRIEQRCIGEVETITGGSHA